MSKIRPESPATWVRHLPSARSMVGISLLLLVFIAPLVVYNHWISLGKPLGFVIGCVMMIIILRELIDQLEGMEMFSVNLYYWLPLRDPETGRFGRSGFKTFARSMPSNDWLERWVKWSLAIGFFTAPIVLGWAFYAQFKHFADITHIDQERIAAFAEQFSAENIGNSALMANLPPWLQTVIANTVDGVANVIIGGGAALLSDLLTNYGKWLIAIFIISTGITMTTYKKEVKYLRYVVERAVPDEQVQKNILNWGLYFKETVGGFVIGYCTVAFLLTGLFIIAMLVLPFNMGLTTIILLSALLGFVTAIPKIGGFVGLGIAGIYMISSPDQGFGWSWLGLENMFSLTELFINLGWVIGSYNIGNAIDYLLRIVIFVAAAKGMGLFEAYRFTPTIIGERLGVTKMLVILTVVMYVSLGGVNGLTWGVVLLCAHLAFLRLDNEGLSPGHHGWKHGKGAPVDDEEVQPKVSLVS